MSGKVGGRCNTDNGKSERCGSWASRHRTV